MQRVEARDADIVPGSTPDRAEVGLPCRDVADDRRLGTAPWPTQPAVSELDPHLPARQAGDLVGERLQLLRPVEAIRHRQGERGRLGLAAGTVVARAPAAAATATVMAAPRAAIAFRHVRTDFLQLDESSLGGVTASTHRGRALLTRPKIRASPRSQRSSALYRRRRSARSLGHDVKQSSCGRAARDCQRKGQTHEAPSRIAYGRGGGRSRSDGGLGSNVSLRELHRSGLLRHRCERRRVAREHARARKRARWCGEGGAPGNRHVQLRRRFGHPQLRGAIHGHDRRNGERAAWRFTSSSRKASR